MRRVRVLAPGSCGEFIQGIYREQPCLVSCPVDLYSTVQICEGPAVRMLDYKAVRMLELIFEAYGLPRSEKHHIDIGLTSEIPVEKGMASSTADIAGMAKALSAYYDLGMDDQTIADFCIRIEPTDNIMFEDLNLFNHVDGEVIMGFNRSLEASILIVEFKGTVNTVNFHRQQDGYTSREKADFMEVVAQFKAGVEMGSLDLVGQACTQSARLNQKILYKPHLETLIALAGAHGGHGVITGHSGTVVGVIYSEDSFDYTAFMQSFLNRIPKGDYDALFLKSIIPGGLRVEVSDTAL
ncbi:MAG: GHMP kinase [Eubacterium sp.]|nr:GHMP kinase [Eubacterium sp.]